MCVAVSLSCVALFAHCQGRNRGISGTDWSSGPDPEQEVYLKDSFRKSIIYSEDFGLQKMTLKI